MENMDLRVKELIIKLENEIKNVESPFLPGQINQIIPFLKFILKNNVVEKDKVEYVSKKISTIRHFAVDSWPFDNIISVELMEITEVYSKLIERKGKRIK